MVRMVYNNEPTSSYGALPSTITFGRNGIIDMGLPKRSFN